MFKLISNKPIKVAHLQKLANQSMVNGALAIEMVINSFGESKNNFGRLMKRGTFLSKKKIEIWAVKNLFPLDFAIYLSYSEVQKNRKVDNV